MAKTPTCKGGLVYLEQTVGNEFLDLTDRLANKSQRRHAYVYDTEIQGDEPVSVGRKVEDDE